MKWIKSIHLNKYLINKKWILTNLSLSTMTNTKKAMLTSETKRETTWTPKEIKELIPWEEAMIMIKTLIRINSSKFTTMNPKIKTSIFNIKTSNPINSKTGNRKKNMIRWVDNSTSKNKWKEVKTEWTKTR